MGRNCSYNAYRTYLLLLHKSSYEIHTKEARKLLIWGIQYPVRWWSSNSTWWRHQMETFSALLALCEGNPPVTVGFPSQRPVMRSFDVLFEQWLGKQSIRWWFEMPYCSLWCHCNEQGSTVLQWCSEVSIWPSSVEITGTGNCVRYYSIKMR